MNNFENTVEDYIEENIEFIDSNFIHSESVLKYITGKLILRFPKHFNIKKLIVTHPHLFTEEEILVKDSFATYS